MRARAIGAAAAMMLMLGCRQPKTDIIATSTEDVGPYQLTSTVEGQQVTARVCMADARKADEIARRIVEQLKDHNYQTISLDLYASSRPLYRYVWSPAGARRSGITERSSSCSPTASP